MFKLIVVDDEKAICKGICEYIDWNSMQFEVQASFEDGKETIEYIKEKSVDVILTDIEMAEVSGLELARYIYENRLPVKVVIISGYKEFEYARKAVEYGVEHYLLKPINLKKLKEVFLRIKDELEEERRREAQATKEKEKFLELLPELREQFWISLLVGGVMSRDSIRKKINLLQLELMTDKPCGIVDIKRIEESETGYFQRENYYNLVNNMFGGETEGLRYFPVFLSENILKIVAVSCRSISEREFTEKLHLQMEEKCTTALQLLKLKFKAYPEKTFPDFMGMTEYSCMMSSREINVYEDRDMKQEDYERLTQKYKLLMGIINDGNFDELTELVETMYFELRKLPLDQVQQLSINMFSMISNKFMKMGIDFWKDINKKVRYQELLDTNNHRDLKEKCKSMLCDAVLLVKRKQNISSRNFIDQSITYLKEHFGEDVSLEGMADKFFLNPAYYSRLFKQHAGLTFTDYLIELRMEKAKKLLLTGRYKVYEVSEMVGYRSEKYFYRIFKQYTGNSPGEYCRSKSINEE